MINTTAPASDTVTAIQAPSRRNLRARRLIQDSGLFLVLVIAIIFFAATAPNFATTQNFFNVLRSASFVGIVAMGMTFVIIAAEIDISVGANAALSSSILGVLVVQAGLPIPLAVLIVLIVGLLVGAGAGWLRARTNIPSFIVTLGLYLGLRGLAEFITNNASLPISGPLLDFLNGNVLGVPLPALIFLIMFLITWFVARRTVFGRSIYAVGGNPIASRLAGIKVNRIRIAIFAITGFFAAIVGVLLTAQVGTATAVLGNGLEFDVISAVIIGGASLAGGSGSPVGTLIGVLFVTVLGNALVLYGVSSSLQDVVRGIIVIVAVLLTNIQTGLIRQKN